MKHPIREGRLEYKTYAKACKKIEKFYGEEDAEMFFIRVSQSKRDKAICDEFGFDLFRNLEDWHKQITIERGYKFLRNGIK